MIIVCASCGAKNRVPEEKLAVHPNCGQCHQPLLTLAPIELNEQNFSNFISNTDLPVLIDLWAEWCGPCKMMAPILKDVKKELGDSVTIIKVDVDRNPQAANEYQVQGVPTLILFKNGKLLWRQSGVIPKNGLVGVIKKFNV